VGTDQEYSARPTRFGGPIAPDNRFVKTELDLPERFADWKNAHRRFSR
jgi:hypothetical protein